jgi:hypothetical protein
MAENTMTTQNAKRGSERVLDLRKTVKLVATSGHPYREEGEEFEIHENHVEGLKQKQWAVKPGEETKASKPAKVKMPKTDNPEVNAKG